MRDFRVIEETDNGEFITTATVELLEDGVVVETKKFVASSEDPPDMDSDYWNGKSNHAMTQALSYANAFCEVTYSGMIDPDWTPQAGYSHAEKLMALLAKTETRSAPCCKRCGRELVGLPTPCADCDRRMG